jgi:cell division protein FtsN
MQTLLPPPSPVETALESVVADAQVDAPETVSPVEAQQELQLNFASEPESTHAPADDFSASSNDFSAASTDEVSTEEPGEAWSPMSSQEIARELLWQSEATPAEEAPVAAHTASVIEPPLKSVDASRANHSTDAYGLGVRLMQVSPMWLLLAGLSFISFIVLCNWLIKPDEKTGDAARMLLAADNRATNQSLSRVVAPNSTAQSPVNSQAAQPSTNSAVSFIQTEATGATTAQVATRAETIEKPAVEEKAASPASPSNQASEAKASGGEAKAGSGEAKAGKVTIQIGSYNEAAQAEERVANLKSAGYEAQSVAVEIPKRGTWYRVQSGRFVNRDDAERYGKQLRERGIVSNFITTDVQE